MELHSTIRGFLLSHAASAERDRPVDAAAIAGAIKRPCETVIRALRVMQDELGEVTYTPAADGSLDCRDVRLTEKGRQQSYHDETQA
ncbi:MAG TPA: hypothetical protein PLU35_04615 [Phycisphaerales bacterium]|nr:hypothetical protein [Phycisphaerales bacterium]